MKWLKNEYEVWRTQQTKPDWRLAIWSSSLRALMLFKMVQFQTLALIPDIWRLNWTFLMGRSKSAHQSLKKGSLKKSSLTMVDTFVCLSAMAVLMSLSVLWCGVSSALPPLLTRVCVQVPHPCYIYSGCKHPGTFPRSLAPTQPGWTHLANLPTTLQCIV